MKAAAEAWGAHEFAVSAVMKTLEPPASPGTSRDIGQKQMDDRSNQELKSALAEGELSPRKHAIAKEVLRRRRWREASDIRLPPPIAILGLTRLALRRFQGRN
jgi:hypothetical protein